MMQSLFRIIVITFVLSLPMFSRSVAGQAEISIINYDEVNTVQFTAGGEQFFSQFVGSKGDVVYLLAEYVDIVIGDIELDLRDSVGRTVGMKADYAFDNFVISELPGDGTYTVVITAEEPEQVKYVVGLSGYLEDGVDARIEEDGFQTLFLVRAEESGAYTLSLERRSGTLATSFTLVTFSEFFNENVVSVSGTTLSNWSAGVSLDAGDAYVAFLDRNLFSGGGSEATVHIVLSEQ